VLRCWIFFEQYSHEPHIAVNRHWKLHLLAAEQSRLADRFAQNHTRCEHALSVMEQRLSESPWLAAGRYTIADIALCAHTHMAANGGFDLAPHPTGQSKTAEATVVKQQFDSVWARGRSRSARGTESLQTLCQREPNSNHHSLSYDLPRMELDRVDPAHADLCRDFFSRAVVLELSFFEAAYTSLCAIGNIRTCTTKVRLRLCAHARDECRSQSTGPECTQNRKNLEELEE